jgi:hypothetical protein
MSAACSLERGRCRIPGKQVRHRGVIEVRSQGQIQGRVDLGEQPTDPVGRCGDLGSEVVIEAALHSEFGQRFIIQSDGAQRARHGPGSLGDDRRASLASVLA